MKILIATDGSEYSRAAAKKSCGMLEIDKQTTIRIFSVAENILPYTHYGITDEYLAIARKSALEIAENAVDEARHLIRETLESLNVVLETKTVIGFPKEAILDEAENWEADLIVVGSHGRGFLGRMFLGSVSNAIVKHAKCSVLVVRASESELAGNKADSE